MLMLKWNYGFFFIFVGLIVVFVLVWLCVVFVFWRLGWVVVIVVFGWRRGVGVLFGRFFLVFFF